MQSSSLFTSPYVRDVNSKYACGIQNFSRKCSNLFDVAELINRREFLIKQAISIIDDSSSGETISFNEILSSIRTIGLSIVEQIAAKYSRDELSNSIIQSNPMVTPMDYSFKMTHDCDEIIADCIKFGVLDDTIPNRRNPFILSVSIDDIQDKNGFNDTISRSNDIQKSLEYLRYRRASSFLTENTLHMSIQPNQATSTQPDPGDIITTRLPNPPIRTSDIDQLLSISKLPRYILSLFSVSRCLIELCEQLYNDKREMSNRQLKRIISSQSLYFLTYKGNSELFITKMTQALCNVESNSLFSIASAGGLPHPILSELEIILESCFSYMTVNQLNQVCIKKDIKLSSLLREQSPCCYLFLNWLRGIMKFLLTSSLKDELSLNNQSSQVNSAIQQMNELNGEKKEIIEVEQPVVVTSDGSDSILVDVKDKLMKQQTMSNEDNDDDDDEKKKKTKTTTSPITRNRKVKSAHDDFVESKPVVESSLNNPPDASSSSNEMLQMIKNHNTAQTSLQEKVQSLTSSLINCGILPQEDDDDDDDSLIDKTNKTKTSTSMMTSKSQCSVQCSEEGVKTMSHLYNRTRNSNSKNRNESTTRRRRRRRFVISKLLNVNISGLNRVEGSTDDWKFIVGIDSLSADVGILGLNTTQQPDEDSKSLFEEVSQSGAIDESLFESLSSPSLKSVIIPSIYACQVTHQSSLDIIASSESKTRSRKVNPTKSVTEFRSLMIKSLVLNQNLSSTDISNLTCRYSKLIASRNISIIVIPIKKDQLDSKLAFGEVESSTVESDLKSETRSMYKALLNKLTNKTLLDDDVDAKYEMSVGVSIFRNETDDGFEIRCTTTSSQTNLSLNVFDDEMELIFLNSHSGLWTLSKHRWSCLCEVCNVLISRLKLLQINVNNSHQYILTLDRSVIVHDQIVGVWSRVISELYPNVLLPSNESIEACQRIGFIALTICKKIKLLQQKKPNDYYNTMSNQIKLLNKQMIDVVTDDENCSITDSVTNPISNNNIDNSNNDVKVKIHVNCSQFKKGMLIDLKITSVWSDATCRQFIMKFIQVVTERLVSNQIDECDYSLFDIDLLLDDEDVDKEIIDAARLDARREIIQIVISLISIVYLQVPCHVIKLSQVQPIEEEYISSRQDSFNIDSITRHKCYISHAEVLAFVGSTAPDRHSTSMSFVREQFRHRFHSLIDIEPNLTDDVRNSCLSYILSRLIVKRPLNGETCCCIQADVNRYLHYSTESIGTSVERLSFSVLGCDVIISSEPTAKSSNNNLANPLSKIVTQEEMYQIFYGRHADFPNIALNWRRRQAACICLSKEMKITNIVGAAQLCTRLETSLHANILMLEVNLVKNVLEPVVSEIAPNVKPIAKARKKKKTKIVVLGCVEVDEHTTLRELRIIITRQFGVLRDEEDSEDESTGKPPRHYQFISKKHVCSNRQEYTRLCKDEMPGISLVKAEKTNTNSLEDYEAAILIDSIEDRKLLRDASLKSYHDRLDWVQTEMIKRKPIDDEKKETKTGDVIIPVATTNKESDQLSALLDDGWDEQISSMYFPILSVAWVRHLCPLVWCQSNQSFDDDKIPISTSEVNLVHESNSIFKQVSYLDLLEDGPVYIRVGKPSLWPNYAAQKASDDKKKSSRRQTAQAYQQGKIAYYVTKNNLASTLSMLYPPEEADKVDDVKNNKYSAWRSELTSDEVWKSFSSCIIMVQPIYLPKDDIDVDDNNESKKNSQLEVNIPLGITNTSNARTRHWTIKNSLEKPIFDPTLIADSSWWPWRPENNDVKFSKTQNFHTTNWNDNFVPICAVVNNKYKMEKCSHYIENVIPDEGDDLNFRMSWKIKFDAWDVEAEEEYKMPVKYSFNTTSDLLPISSQSTKTNPTTSISNKSFNNLFASNKKASKIKNATIGKPTESELKKKKKFAMEKNQKFISDRKLSKQNIEAACECVVYFRISFPKFLLEQLIVDVPMNRDLLNCQRCDYVMSSSSAGDVIAIAYNVACTIMLPKSSSLTIEKFCSLISLSKMFESLRPEEAKAGPNNTSTTEVSEFDKNIENLSTSLFKAEVESASNVTRSRNVSVKGFYRLLSKISVVIFCPDLVCDEEDDDSVEPMFVISDAISIQGIESNRSGPVTPSNERSISSAGRQGTIFNDELSMSSIDTLESIAQRETKRIQKFILEKLVWSFIASIPGEVSCRIWKRAKDAALDREGLRQCACIRIQASLRGMVQKRSFRVHISSSIIIESLFRSLQAKLFVKAWKYQIKTDRLFRSKYWGAARMQSVIRMFIHRRRYKKARSEKRQLEFEYYKLIRVKGNERKCNSDRRTIFKSITRIASEYVTVTLRMANKSINNEDSTEACSSKISLASTLSVYLTSSQRCNYYDLSDAQYREFMAVSIVSNMQSKNEAKHSISLEQRKLINTILESKGTCLSYSELLNPLNILTMIQQRLVSRQKTAKMQDAVDILLCRRSAGYSGKRLLRRAVSITGGHKIFQSKRDADKSSVTSDLFVVTVYAASTEISLHAYHARSCMDLSTTIDLDSLMTYMDSLNKAKKHQSKGDFDLVSSCSKLIDNLVIKSRQTSKDSDFSAKTSLDYELLCGFQVNFNIENDAAIAIQLCVRRYQSVCKLHQQIGLRYVKVWDGHSRGYYYLNTVSKESYWTKECCKILARFDVPEPQTDHWIALSHVHGAYYLNPYRGTYSSLSEVQAACIIQSMVRHKFERLIFTDSLSNKVKAFALETNAESVYLQAMRDSRVNPSQPVPKLGAVVNYALHQQLFSFNNTKSLEAYKASLTISPNNPIILRSYAIFLLATSLDHRKATTTRALEMIHQAHVLDRFGEKFQTAFKLFYQFACFRHSNDHRVLLAMALCYQCVWNNYEIADYTYRRALRLAPHDELLVANYEEFELNRLPDGLYAGGGPGCNVVQSSVIEKRCAEWGEWETRINTESKQQLFKRFWYNSLSETTQWREPNWADHNKIRLVRSIVLHIEGNWQTMQDVRISHLEGRNDGLMYCNAATNEVCFSRPAFL